MLDRWLVRGAVAVVVALQFSLINDFAIGTKWLSPVLELILDPAQYRESFEAREPKTRDREQQQQRDRVEATDVVRDLYRDRDLHDRKHHEQERDHGEHEAMLPTGQNGPPSTPMRCPVRYDARPDTTKRTASATSSGEHT